jgi:S-adenosylmethionine:tRNA ribosyltransferase-isomerase
MVRLPSNHAFAPGFELPDALSAKEPPELRGLSRDGVRLLAADRGSGGIRHGRFHDLASFLEPGDCLVLNASRTLPASLPALLTSPPPFHPDGPGMAGSSRTAPVEVRLARRIASDTYLALLLDPFGNPMASAVGILRFRDGLEARLDGPGSAHPRLHRLRFPLEGSALMERLSPLGQPVRYWYAERPWELDRYQTVFAREPGSMEMPSAGRAFTWRMLLDLRRRGIQTAYLVLHAGLSSYMDAEFDATHPISVEPYRISPGAAAAVNAAKARGGRIVAVGTTVVRALESAVGPEGMVLPGEATTALRITAGHRLRVADGLITGFHEPEASHLDLLSAFLPPRRLRAVYDAALREGYLWHEFGDINLIL